MADRQLGLDVRPYLPHAAAATLGVVALPAALIFALLFLVDPDPHVLITSALSIGLTAAATTLGAALWMRQERSSELSFGDLMLWAWFRRKRAEERLKQSVDLLGLDRTGIPLDLPHVSRSRQLRILHDLNDALETKDPYTRGHADRVERHAFRTGAAMGLSIQELDDLRLAAALHDVGKIRVPDKILRKEGPLTDDEREVMSEHPSIGAMMVSHVGSKDVIEAVRHHHEHWNGRGYPDGLAGAEIPLFARIISVADTYDAITSTRSYRVRSERHKAVSILKAEAGSQFDPMAVEVFCEALPQRVPVMAIFMLMPSALREGAKQIALLFTRQGVASITAGAAAAGAAVGISAAAVRPLATLPVETKPIVRQVAAPDGNEVASATGSSHRSNNESFEVRPGRRSDKDSGRSSGFRAQRRGGGSRAAGDEGAALPSPSPEPLSSVPVVEEDSSAAEVPAAQDDDSHADSGGGGSGNEGEDSGGDAADERGNGSGSSNGQGDNNGNDGNGKKDGESGSSNGGNVSGSSNGKENGKGSGNDNSNSGGNGKGKGKGDETPPPDPTDDGTVDGDDGDGTDGGSSDGDDTGNGNGNDNGNAGGNGNGNGGDSDGGSDSSGGGNSGGNGGGNSGGNGNGGGNDKDKGGGDDG